MFINDKGGIVMDDNMKTVVDYIMEQMQHKVDEMEDLDMKDLVLNCDSSQRREYLRGCFDTFSEMLDAIQFYCK
jgi:hypothetical protein